MMLIDLMVTVKSCQRKQKETGCCVNKPFPYMNLPICCHSLKLRFTCNCLQTIGNETNKGTLFTSFSAGDAKSQGADVLCLNLSYAMNFDYEG